MSATGIVGSIASLIGNVFGYLKIKELKEYPDDIKELEEKINKILSRPVEEMDDVRLQKYYEELDITIRALDNLIKQASAIKND